MPTQRTPWDQYFMQFAELAATRSTCLGAQVGAALVRDKQLLATGYNGVPPGLPHCTDLGECYPGVLVCSESTQPSRAIHAEANAIAQAAKYGIRAEGTTIYVTLEPCLSCLKLLVAAGVQEIVYRDVSTNTCTVKHEYHTRTLIKIRQLEGGDRLSLPLIEVLEDDPSDDINPKLFANTQEMGDRSVENALSNLVKIIRTDKTYGLKPDSSYCPKCDSNDLSLIPEKPIRWQCQQCSHCFYSPITLFLT